jgi:hypothetical protein
MFLRADSNHDGELPISRSGDGGGVGGERVTATTTTMDVLNMIINIYILTTTH